VVLDLSNNNVPADRARKLFKHFEDAEGLLVS